MMRGHLDQLVLLYILKRFLKRELDCRWQNNLLIRPCGTHVGKLLGLADIDVEVTVPRVFTHDLARLDILTRLHEEATAVQKLVHRISNGLACLK